MRLPIADTLRTLAGVVAALVVCEVPSRIWFGEYRHGHHLEVRQFAEGTSTANYRVDAKLAGVARRLPVANVPGAPTLLIIGDSYVVARQVGDDDTFGTLVARRSRDEGDPINVVQYGVAGGAAPEYAAEAKRLLARWQPAWVIVIIPTNDLTEEPLTYTPRWRMRLGDDGEVDLVKAAPRTSGAARNVLDTTIDRVLVALRPYSGLAQLLILRRGQMITPPTAGPNRAAPPDVTRVPDASVALLRRAFGDRLAIVHLTEISLRTNREATPAERRLAQVCHDAGVPFASARESQLALRDRFTPGRGFHNILPGTGHLNEIGHRALAEVIWELLTRLRAPTRLAGTKGHVE